MKQKLLNLRSSDKALFITAAVLFVLGLVLAIIPELSLKALCYILGAVSLVFGIVKIAAGVGDKNDGIGGGADITFGVIAAVFGGVLLLHPAFVLYVLPFLIGIAITVSGVLSFRKAKFSGSLGGKITAAVTAIAGILIIFNSFKTAVTATRVIGAALVVCGVEIFYETYETAKKRREGKLIDDNGYIEVDFKDVDK